MPQRDVTPLGAPCWVDLFTSDIDGAAAFYGGLFGWTAESAGPEYGGYVNYHKDGKAVAGGMHNDGSQGTPDAWSIYLATNDAEATVDAAVARGGTVIVPAMQVMSLGSMAVMLDIGGASIGAWQPGEHRGFEVFGEPGTPAWFELHTREYEPSVSFYREVFGWTTAVESDIPEFRYTTYKHDEMMEAGIMDAAPFTDAGAPAQWSIYFAVDSTDEAVAKAVELGGAVVAAPMDSPYGRLATVTDPTGALFRLTAQG